MVRRCNEGENFTQIPSDMPLVRFEGADFRHLKVVEQLQSQRTAIAPTLFVEVTVI